MPHLPETWKERRDADRERKIDRVMSDSFFQWTRTTRTRRVLVVVATALCVAVIPAFAQGGSIIGIMVTAAAWAVWGLLRMSVRTVADLPDRFLDERQRALRNRAYVYAYLILGWVVCALATAGLVAFVIVSDNDAATVTATWGQGIGLVLSVTLLTSLLPSMVVAWLDAGEESEEVIVEIL